MIYIIQLIDKQTKQFFRIMFSNFKEKMHLNMYYNYKTIFYLKIVIYRIAHEHVIYKLLTKMVSWIKS